MSLKSNTSKDSLNKNLSFLRYPGGKQKHLSYFHELLPISTNIMGNYVEPFVGGGAVFFYVNPKKAILADKNRELINLYRGIKDFPADVWQFYINFPATKTGYYEIRDSPSKNKSLPFHAARTLFLNRTCFKGMWRHNSQGKFNVGYGGQERRWVLNKEDLFEVSKRLTNAVLKCSDFEKIIDSCDAGDFIFLDPPYKPGEKEQTNKHYCAGKFTYEDQQRLAQVLDCATHRGVKWLMTNSCNTEIMEMYEEYNYVFLQRGTSGIPGTLIDNPGEVVIHNLGEG
jgi:DNA adenine methylase